MDAGIIVCNEALTDAFGVAFNEASDLANDDFRLLRCDLPSSLSAPLLLDPLRSDPAMFTGLVVMRRSRANKSSARSASHGVIWKIVRNNGYWELKKKEHFLGYLLINGDGLNIPQELGHTQSDCTQAATQQDYKHAANIIDSQLCCAAAGVHHFRVAAACRVIPFSLLNLLRIYHPSTSAIQFLPPFVFQLKQFSFLLQLQHRLADVRAIRRVCAENTDKSIPDRKVTLPK